MFIKLCGLRSLEDTRAAIKADATALGFNFAPESTRRVAPDFVAGLRDVVVAPPTFVGITVNLSASENLDVFDEARLDMLQLSGDEPTDILFDLDVPLIKTVRIPGDASVDDAVRAVDAWLNHAKAPELVIVEGQHGGAYGGTGQRANSRLVREISVRYPIVLAGGLTPENVEAAIREIEPIGVDTASGVEKDGIKDAEMMTAFVANAREAYTQL
ncbi:MAG: phosphoribosylanthranilate isomerase [Thermomicrobiales bacterium]|nr:phosphoribosylanthranilate isomerase [Thermomicrobiales bacterium]MCO5217804.1 phosphoribosylanthranilate isomerase [Thermomicrobiales bacterium]MCO5223939.1 phosphoribosylanthranilate isomerase [Thermomicrobiales bacterium]MCO5227502.1 phosphoribosylanthranilate isomerase [Thermomicrobiales bacterium]